MNWTDPGRPGRIATVAAETIEGRARMEASAAP